MTGLISFGFETHYCVMIYYSSFTRALRNTLNESFFWDFAIASQFLHVNSVVVFLAEFEAKNKPMLESYNREPFINTTFCWSNRINYRLLSYNFNCVQLTSITQSMFLKNTYGRNLKTWQIIIKEKL